MPDDGHRLAATLIFDIYSALIGNATWQSFLERLSGMLPNGKATLFYHDLTLRSGAFSLNAQFEPAWIDAYKGHFAARNPWMAKASVRPLDLGVCAEQMLPAHDLARTEFYSDFMRPQRLQSAVGVTVFRDRGCNFMLSVLHGAVEEAEAKSAARLLGTLAPHLRQAFTYYRRAGAVAGASSVVGAASDALGVGIVALGVDRRIRWANRLAEDLLCAGDPVGLDTLGRVAVSHREVRDAIDSALGEVRRGEGAGRTAVLAVPGRRDEPSFRVTVVVPELSESEAYFAGPFVLLLLERTDPSLRPAADALRTAFALTESEVRLARALAAGTSLSEAAASHNITRETARTQLKRVFAKVGVHRQAELVAKVHQLDRRTRSRGSQG